LCLFCAEPADEALERKKEQQRRSIISYVSTDKF